MVLKRCFDIFSSFLGLLFLGWLLFVIAFLIKVYDGGSVFFKQERIGLREKPFYILKFRTMIEKQSSLSLQITSSKDTRITPIGCFLRKTKLDELPQLWNVLKGEMSLVGPRPEVAKYVNFYSNEDKKIIFSVRPGITDEASAYFRNESDILAQSEDPEKCYIEEILPQKIQFYRDYVQKRSFFGDLVIIVKTFVEILR